MNKIKKRLSKLSKNTESALVIGTAFGQLEQLFDLYSTIFVVKSSGLTSDMLVCEKIVKNDLLMNIIDEAEVQSNIFVERGKNSALERVERLGEVDNVGDLVKYGYKFFNVSNSI